MKNAPLVSVMVAVYNSEHYIAQAIESILVQKCTFTYEILVGDDASTDGTLDILRNYENNYKCIKVFPHSQHIGGAKNYYELLTKAKGAYIALLDGDDYWCDPLKLQKQIDYLILHPYLIGCAHRCIIVNAEGKKLSAQKIRFVKVKNRFTFNDFAGFYLPGQPSTFLRKNIFRSKENLEILKSCLEAQITDRFSMALFLSKGDFGFINEAMSCYRIHSDSMTGTFIKNDPIKSELILTEELERFCLRLFKRSITFKKYRRDLYLSALYEYLRHGKKENRLLFSKIENSIWQQVKCMMYFPIWFLKKIHLKLTCAR